MAAFLTNGDVSCLHDGLRFLKSRDEFNTLMGEYTGLSDSGLVVTDFQRRFPNSKTVVIEREIEQCVSSLLTTFSENGWDVNDEVARESVVLLTILQKGLKAVEGMRVPFQHLDSYMPDICDYIGVQYDERRHVMFQTLNIQTTDWVPRQEAYGLWSNNRIP